LKISSEKCQGFSLSLKKKELPNSQKEGPQEKHVEKKGNQQGGKRRALTCGEMIPKA